MRAAAPPLTLPPTLPEGPAGYGALVHAIAAAQAANHADPVTAGVHALAQAAQTAWQTRLAARLGLQWPLPDGPASPWQSVGAAWMPPWPASGLALMPDVAAAMDAGRRWMQAATGLVTHFDDLAAHTQRALQHHVAVRPVRSVPALHGAFLRAWHAAHTAAVNAPALTQRLHDLGTTSAQVVQAAHGLSPLRVRAGG